MAFLISTTKRRFNLELFCVSQTEVGKHVARTAMHLNAINKMSFHLRNSFTYASAALSLA